jgi:hypothetical protein
VVEPEARQDLRSHRGDDDVARRDERLDDLAAERGLEVHVDGPLVAQEVQGDAGELGVRPGSHHAARVAPGRLEQHDVGPLVGQDLRGQRAHDDAREVEDADARERP